jgi:hypothetical protein
MDKIENGNVAVTKNQTEATIETITAHPFLVFSFIITHYNPEQRQ